MYILVQLQKKSSKYNEITLLQNIVLEIIGLMQINHYRRAGEKMNETCRKQKDIWQRYFQIVNGLS